MWVRSQDRKVLGNFTEFKVLSGEQTIIVGYQGGIDAEGAPLATYESEEKAIKAIDYIHHLIKKGYKNTPTAKEEVFMMPENNVL